MKEHSQPGKNFWYEDVDHRKDDWNELKSDQGCALDFISTSALLEWLNNEKVIKIVNKNEARFNRYRKFSKLCDWNAVIPQLILFDEVLLSIGMFYKQNIDLNPLQKYGFFSEFPRPVESRFIKLYELITPVVKTKIGKVLQDITGKPFSEIWTPRGYDARDEFKNYYGLAEWLFYQSALDTCGLPSKENEMFERLKKEYTFEFFDFVEYACAGQGHFLDSPIPYLSSVLEPSKQQTDVVSYQNQQLRGDIFALYKLATSNVLGFQPVVNKFEDVLRLREDKNITKLRRLLSKYRNAITVDEREIVKEIESEISVAKKYLDKFSFAESPVYTYIVKVASFVPVAGNVISYAGNCVDLIKYFRKIFEEKNV